MNENNSENVNENENMNANENANVNENASVTETVNSNDNVNTNVDVDDNVKLENLKKDINVLKGKLTTLGEKKKSLEDAAHDLIAKTIYEKRKEIERSHDEVIKEAELRLKATEKEKDSERKKNLDRIVDQNTRKVREDNIYLENEIKRILKDNQLPSFVNTSFYMTIWNPTKISEVLCSSIISILILVIPTILSFIVYKDNLKQAFPSDFIRYIIIVLIYLAFIFVFGIIWLFVEKWTKKKPEVIKEIAEIRKNIKDNKKEIAVITRDTNNKITDDQFDYTKLDREIEAGKIEVENYKNKKKEAIDHFVNVSEQEITKKVEFEANKEIDIINAEIEKVKAELSDLQSRHDELKLQMASK